MIRKKKKFDWPKKLYDKPRIDSENKIVSQYGLKNKREIWKTESKIKYFRTRAKELITSSTEDQQIFLSNLHKSGLKVNSIAEVLALNVEDLLKRRLSTVVYNKGLANTPDHARQMIVHKKVLVGDKMMNSPSYLVSAQEENEIKIKQRKPASPKMEAKTEETNEEGEVTNE